MWAFDDRNVTPKTGTRPVMNRHLDGNHGTVKVTLLENFSVD